VKLDLQPPQAASVQRVVRQLLAHPARPEVDRWWRAGLAEALGEPDEPAQGATTALPRRTRGAERA
jgi:hypothetical protein